MKKLLLVYVFVFLFKSESYCQIFSNEEKSSQYKAALEMYNEDKFDIAISFCTKILDNGTTDVEVSRLRAMAYRAEGEYDKSARDYSEAIRYQPAQYGKRDPSLYFDRAMVYMWLKKFREALNDLYDARRLFKQAGGNENFTYLEEIGRANHYMGDNKSAINSLTDAIQNGSSSAYIDLLSSLLQSNNIADIKLYSDSLLKGQQTGFMANSMYFNYISTLNDIAYDSANVNTLQKINSVLKSYRTTNSNGFEGFYYDLLYARAYVLSFMGMDSSAYIDFHKIYATNHLLTEVKSKVDYLKIKLGLDTAGPAIALRDPVVNADKTAFINASKGKRNIFGQVTDSSGVAQVTVSYNGRDIPIPSSSIENDGLFETKIELSPGRNPITISATDKNDNRSEETFYINFSEREQNTKEIDTTMTDDIPEINTSVNYYALLIAEKDYEDDKFKDLETPIADAAELKDILVGQYEFDEKNVKLLPNASRTEIIDTLFKLCKMMTDADNLLVFYAGHGDVKRVNNQIEGGFIIPTDAKKGLSGSYISSDDLLEPVSGSQAKHILFIVDACFGGALLTRSSIDEASQGIKNLYNNKSRRVLTSGNLEEVPDKGKFISNLKHFLRYPEKTYFSGNDLYTYILNNNNSTAVNPMFERIKNTGIGNGQFIFVRRH